MDGFTYDELFYFVFGITPDTKETDEEGIKTCIHKAYLDMCRTLTYKKNNNDSKKKTLEDVEQTIKQGILNYPVLMRCAGDSSESVFTVGDWSEFDIWHYCLSMYIKEKMNRAGILMQNQKGKPEFKIGQAQKWINMSLKYMRIMGILSSKFEESQMHIPIDDYILNAASKPEGEQICESYDVSGIGIVRTIQAWSKIDEYSVYKEFQDSVREKTMEKGIAPIRWEDKAWIAEAVSRSNGKQ